jgi:pantetheine-phosphate adenylyltransferase
MADRVAVYPGSFDPVTFGHLDLIQRALRIFDSLIVAVAQNAEKNALFSVDERLDMLRQMTKDYDNVTVTSFDALTAEFAREQGAIALVRGFRVVSDFEFELTMAIANHKLNPEVDTVCLMPSEEFMLVSSRLVREIAEYGGDLSEFVPPEIEACLKRKLGT